MMSGVSSLYLEKQGPLLSLTNVHITRNFICPMVYGGTSNCCILGRRRTGKRCCNNGKQCLPSSQLAGMGLWCIIWKLLTLNFSYDCDTVILETSGKPPDSSLPAAPSSAVGKQGLSFHCIPGTVTTARGSSAGC